MFTAAAASAAAAAVMVYLVANFNMSIIYSSNTIE